MRTLRIAAIVLLFLAWIFWMSVDAKSRKVKVYLDAPVNIGHNESFTFHLMEQMRLADYDDDSFEFVWIKNAIEADYIITLMADQNKLPVMVKTGENTYETCKQTLITVLLDKLTTITVTGQVEVKGQTVNVTLSRRGVDPDKTHHMVNQQLDCDPDEMAKRAVAEMLVAMGLRPATQALR